MAGGTATGVLPAGWSFVATGDFNGNESNDLLLQNESTLGVWFVQNGP